MSTEKVPVVVEEEEVEEEVRKYPLRTVIQLIMQSFEPVSTEPGYLLYVRNYLENEEDVPMDIQLILPILTNIVRYLVKNEKKLRKVGYVEFLKSCESRPEFMPQMFMSVEMMNVLRRFVKECNQSVPASVEDCSLLVNTVVTSTSSTIVRVATEAADVISPNKRKFSPDLDDDLFDDDLFPAASRYPSYETSSNIFLRKEKGGECQTSELVDEFKDRRLKLVLWYPEDMKGKPKDVEWKHYRKQMTLNFESGTTSGLMISEAVKTIERETRNYLKQNGGKPKDWTKRSRLY
uniref:NS2 n=1 Tax=uncultured densovirus TaxID=748192 RepID=A0A7M4CBJ3_9VIRU|nr:NS2 [uncultured densovirus]